MPYLICKKCKGYYELEKEESIEDFESCLCNGELKYVENLNHVYYGNTKTKKNSKIVDTSLNYKWVSIISIASLSSIILIIFYFNNLYSLIMEFSVPLAVLLVLLTNLRFILIKLDTDNTFIKFIQLKSIFMIIPLFILFIGIIVSRIIAI